MQIVFLITAPLFVIALILLLITFFMSAEVSKLVLHQSYSLVGPCIARWFYTTVFFTFLSLFTFVLLAFKLAYDMVNPFSRIITEVDEILITGSKRTIVVRPEDELAKEVSDRFNNLITLIPSGTQKN